MGRIFSAFILGYALFQIPAGAAAGTAAAGVGATSGTHTSTLGPGSRSAAAPGAAKGPSAASLYLILVVGAVAALGGAQVLRLIGVRLAWTS